MGTKQKRDIYKKRTDSTFDVHKDIDLEDLRDLMTTPILTDAEYNRYGIYCENLIKILYNSSKFVGYDADVKEELRDAALPDIIKARTSFKASYTAPTAPFSYLYRIAYNAFARTLGEYYKRGGNRICCISELPPETQEAISDKMTDWDEIADVLREYSHASLS